MAMPKGRAKGEPQEGTETPQPSVEVMVLRSPQASAAEFPRPASVPTSTIT